MKIEGFTCLPLNARKVTGLQFMIMNTINFVFVKCKTLKRLYVHFHVVLYLSKNYCWRVISTFEKFRFYCDVLYNMNAVRMT